MTHVEILDAARDRADSYKVDASRGQRIGRVSSEWFSRPADERYLSLSDLYAAVRGRTERSRTRTIESAAIRVEASRDDAERLALMLPGSDVPIPHRPRAQYKPRLSPVPCDPTNNVTTERSPSSIGGGSFSIMRNCTESSCLTRNL